MKFNICHIVFSTNRLKYLTKSLESEKYINYENCNVDKILIDDYPYNRDDAYFLNEIKKYNFNEVILHNENMGITKTWQEFFDLVKNRNYDYILHHEDDVVLLEEIKIYELIEILIKNNDLFQIQLKRNNWYQNEIDENTIKEDDLIFNKYRIHKQSSYFMMLFSLYPAWITKEPIKEELNMNPSEGVISYYLKNKYNLCGCVLKKEDGGFLVEHIGEYTQGKRVCENEPGWEGFKNFDPLKKYNSKTGYEYLES